MALTAGTASGCADLPDDAQTDPDALTFGSTTRVMKRTCGKRCSKYTGFGIPDIRALKCVQWVDDCYNVPWTAATLHADAAAASANAVFPTWNQPDWDYWGCGPQAAQNVLSYYGVNMRVQDIAGEYIPTFALLAGSNDQNIATYPDSLASGLQRLLNEKLGNHFVVQRRSGVHSSAETTKAINKGNPIILLVNSGGHYVTAMGYGPGGTHVRDYPGQDRQVIGPSTEFDFSSSFFSFVSLGAGGFENNTVITIDYVP